MVYGSCRSSEMGVGVEFEHPRAFQQYEGFVSQATLFAVPFRPRVYRTVPHPTVSVKQLPPVACFGGGCQIAFAEGLDTVVGDAAGGIGIVDEWLDLVGEIAEVALDFNVVLVGPGRDEEVVVVLDVLEFVRDDDGVAGLAIFEGSRVRPS